ncbi:MAG: hypothetical protein ACFB03_01255 [Paracoccaceae bacterium]
MKLFGGIFGSSGGGDGEPRSLFVRSVDGFATMAALAATVFAVPVLWFGIESWVARELVRLYGDDMAIIMFWALKLGAYPLVFFAIRMSLATTYAALAISVAMRFL